MGPQNRDLPDKLEGGYRLPPVGLCPLRVYVLMLKCWDEEYAPGLASHHPAWPLTTRPGLSPPLWKLMSHF